MSERSEGGVTLGREWRNGKGAAAKVLGGSRRNGRKGIISTYQLSVIPSIR
jgi:hypothetical protein